MLPLSRTVGKEDFKKEREREFQISLLTLTLSLFLTILKLISVVVVVVVVVNPSNSKVGYFSFFYCLSLDRYPSGNILGGLRCRKSQDKSVYNCLDNN